jgi:Carboxypeptidase regulatory-like domain
MSGRGLRSRFVVFVLLTMVAAGCGGQQASTAPTAVAPASVNTPSPPPSTRAVQLHIVGRVLDSTDKPVPGARITQWDTANTTTTDASGTFEMTGRVTPQDRWFWVTVEKPGFETSELARDVAAAANTSLRLHQIRTIGAGESIQGVVSADDPACGYHWGYVCRRVRVSAPASGTLIAEITADGADLGVAPAGLVGFPQPLERRISVPVKVGSEIMIDVSAGFDIPAAARFTLNTALAP